VNEVDIKSGIVYYDAPFEIEPMDGVFRSRQRVTLAADQPKSNTLTIYLANILVIDHLATEYDQGKELPLRGWNKIGSNTNEYFWGKLTLSEIEVETKSKLPTRGHLVVILEYHLPADMIRQERTDNIYNLFASTLRSHA
jgi:hypothetical protein